MTVDELIAQLAQYPGDYEVVLNVQDFATMTEAEGVRPGHYNENRAMNYSRSTGMERWWT